MAWKEFRRRRRVFLRRLALFAAAKCHDYSSYIGKP